MMGSAHSANLHYEIKIEGDGTSELMTASKCGNMTVVKTLLELGVDADEQDRSGRTALMMASETGNMEVVKILLESGADPNIRDKYDRMTALMIASLTGHIEVVKILLENGVDPGERDYYGRTALMMASEMGRGNVVTILLENGADLNKENHLGEKAFISAVKRQNVDVVKILLEKGADPNQPDIDRWTALMMASRRKNLEMVKVLLEGRANPNIHDKDGSSVLMIASKAGNSEIVKILLEKGADLYKQDKGGRTALMIGSQSDHTEVVKILLKNGADPNIQDNEGMTALMNTDGPDTVAYLLDHGADPNLVDKRKRTVILHKVKALAHHPFHSTFCVCTDVLCVLIEKGATPIVHISYRQWLYEQFLEICTKYFPDDFFEQVLYLVVNNGLLKYSQVSEYVNVQGKSPMQWALRNYIIQAVKYMFACCYITNADLKLARRVISENQSPHPFQRTQTDRWSDRFTEEREMAMVNFLQQALSQPWPLVKLAFIAVSSALGPSPQREKVIKQSRLPPKVQRMLMFQTPSARLPASEWSNISLCFDPVQYETLPRPRPLLDYWPVGRHLNLSWPSAAESRSNRDE